MIWNLAIRRPVLTAVVFLALAVFGIYGYTQLPVREYPDVEFPVVSVSVVLQGAGPEVVETEVVEPLEESLNTIEGIKNISSTSRQNVGTVMAEFELYRDIDVAAQDVRDRVSRARPDMADDIEEPIVRKIDPDAQAVMWVALTGDRRWDQVRMTEYAEDHIQEALEGLPGVGQVQIGGSRRYAVRIALDPAKLSAYRLTVAEVVQVIQRENVEIPSGQVVSQMREFTVNTRGRFSSAEPFNELILAYRQGAPVRLADVGRAVDGVENERTRARFTGEPSVGLGIVKQSDANMVELVERVRQRLSEIEKGLPPGLTYQVASDDSLYVKENIRDLLLTIFIATALVVAVILFFLGTVRGTLITSIAIPTSLAGGMAAMHYFGFSLNVLSMLGLLLVIGIVVDDAIIVLESVYRHMQAGSEAKPAARTGTTEIAFAAMANTLSLAAVFIPVAFTPGMIGRFFYEFGLTVAVTVAVSTFTALTLTAMLCSRILTPASVMQRPVLLRWTGAVFSAMEAVYRRMLAACLNHRWITVLTAAAVFVCGVLLFTLVETEFAPSVDRGEFAVAFEAVEGASIDATDRHAKKIEAVFSQVPEIRSYFLAIGLARAGPGRVNEGISFVRLTPREERRRSQEQIMQAVREKLRELTGLRAFVMQQGGPARTEAPLQVVLKHPDLLELARRKDRVMAWMRQQPEYTGVKANMKLDKPEVRVQINRNKAGEMNVSAAEIGNTLRYIFGDPQISTIQRENRRYDVITEIAGAAHTPEAIYRLYLRNESGQMVSMANLVNIEEGVAPSEIHHYNRSRSVTVQSQLPAGVAMGPATDKLTDYLAGQLPPSFDRELSGRAQDFKESFFYLTITLGFAVLFVYLVLAGQFESFLHPMTILLTLPLASIGVFGPLVLFDMTFSIFAFIGLIFLVGLVTKTGILLVDYANVLRARGDTILEAAQKAGETRFRPVVMTASSTILGMLPIALGYGAGGNARASMGVVICLGNLVSTALTLLVIPVVYTLVDELQQKVLRHRMVSLVVGILLAGAAALTAWLLFGNGAG